MSGPTRTLPTYKSQKMLASTVQFSTNNQTPPTTPPPDPPPPRGRRRYEKQDGPEPRQHTRPHQGAARSLRTQQRAYDRPTAATPFHATPAGAAVLGAATAAGRTGQRSTLEHHPRHAAATRYGHRSRRGRGSGPLTRGERPVLLRKEVIQPHLPVRLPCYDFVPIADPAFDGSLPQGVGPPASGVTDFRDVTGGVYKARERIHRSVADLRLLATPTSWGRVADPNPN